MNAAIMEKMEQQKRSQEEKFECPLCNKKVAKKYNLRRHMMIHTGERPFSCDICFKQFREFSGLKHHRQVHASDAEFMCMACGIYPPCDENPTKCAMCAAKDPPRKTAISEMVVENMRVIQNGQKKLYICPECDRVFTNTHNLKRHYLVHTGEKPFKCELCSKNFRDLAILKKHTKTQHQAKKLNNSAENTSMQQQIASMQPMGVTTANVSPGIGLSGGYLPERFGEGLSFDCLHCGAKFTTISSYTEHLKVHTSSFTFQCFICKLMFETKERLKTHFDEHDKEDGYA